MIMLSVIEICLLSERLVLSKTIFLINMRQLRLDFFGPKKPKSAYDPGIFDLHGLCLCPSINCVRRN